MENKELAEKLSAVMDAVSVCEGLIYTDLNGEVIIGQTLLEMDHKEIGKKVADILNSDLGSVQKGDTSDITIEFSDGALVAVRGKDNIIIGLLGKDGLSSKGLLRRQLLNLVGR